MFACYLESCVFLGWMPIPSICYLTRGRLEEHIVLASRESFHSLYMQSHLARVVSTLPRCHWRFAKDQFFVRCPVLVSMTMLSMCIVATAPCHLTERTLTAELESLRHIATVREEDRARRTKAEHQRVGAVLDDLTATSAVQQEQHDAFQERIHQLEQTCSKLRDERSYYQRQLHDAEQQQKLQQQQQVHSSRDAHQDQPPPLPADGLQQENRQLKKALQRFESQLKEIQQDLRAVKEERDNLSLLYRQVRGPSADCSQLYLSVIHLQCCRSGVVYSSAWYLSCSDSHHLLKLNVLC